jgi:hypothetical protein
LAYGPPALGLPSFIQLGQGGIRVLLYVRYEPGLGRSIEVAGAAPAGGFRGQRASLTLVAQQLFEKRNAYPKVGGDGSLASARLAVGRYW